MRRACQPFIREADGAVRPLLRVELTDRTIAEEELQRLIHASPEVLPIAEIEPSFGPVVGIGREVRTNVGYIDNLLISPGGAITLVEAKLWRNPQATRDVVAQALDYAKELSRWSYEDLEQAVAQSKDGCLKADESLYQFVRHAFPEHAVEERDFVDATQRALSHGRFLLLIVGDGIRENIEQMVKILHTTPSLRFTFSLVELQLFEDREQGNRIILPQVVARTTEIVRAVVRFEGRPSEPVTVDVDSDGDAASPSKKRLLTHEEFFEKISNTNIVEVFRELADRARQMGARIEAGSSELLIRAPEDVSRGQKLTLVALCADGKLKFAWLPVQLERVGYSSEIAWRFYDQVVALFPNTHVRRDNPNAGTIKPWPKADHLRAHMDDFLAALQRVIEDVRREAEGVPA